MGTARARMSPVIETGQTLRVFFEVEREIVRTLSTLVPRVGDLELKYRLCEHVWESAQHARFLRERGRELGAFGSSDEVRPGVARIFDEVIRHPDPFVCLTAFSRVLSDGLRGAYAHYLEAAEPLADWPTRNLVQEFVSDAERQSLELEPWLVDGDRSTWSGHLDAALRALGGWNAERDRVTLGEDFRWSSDHGSYTHPAQPNRAYPTCASAFGEDPAEFPLVKSWLTDPATDPAIIRVMIYIWLMNEADAVDYLATMFFDTPTAPFDYHFDLARHLWDESRHSQFGFRQLPRLGIDLATIEQQISFYDALVRMAPHERYVMMTWHFEAGSFDIKAEVMDRVRELGDFEADTLLAFDRSDEQNHVRYGHRWLPALLELYGETRDAKTFAVETARRFTELEADAAASIGHGLPVEKRLTANRIRTFVEDSLGVY